MRLLWVLPLGVLLLVASPALGDPSISMPSSTQGVATWTFTNPANYTASSVALSIGEAALARTAGAVADSTAGEFSQALVLSNVDLASRPGEAVVANTSLQGPPVPLTYQPGPTQLDDNYLWTGGGSNTNFGLAPDLYVGYWGNPEWTRAILHWPSLPLPANATLVSATLQLYLHSTAQTNAMDITAHRMTTAWTELGSSWNDYDGANPWNTTGGGGDFNTTVIDAVTGITTVPGWYGWNVTPVARSWWMGTSWNLGILLRQANDDLRVSLGQKHFYSSDAPNASARPRFLLTYTTPSSTAVLESRVLGPGTPSAWRRVWWNATTPAGTAVRIETRTGNSPAIDAGWSPWSAPYAGPGVAIASPPGSYIQYRAILFTPSSASPALQDVSLEYDHFAASGAVATAPFLPQKLLRWGLLELNWTGPAATGVALAVSNDNGTSWTPAASGTDLSAAPATAVLLRLTLRTNETTVTPRVHFFSVEYVLLRDGGGGLPNLPVVGPYWILLIPFLILAAWTVAMSLRRAPFDATDLFLIHTDGRLILRVGGKESPLRDELAVSGMFTLVAQFVKDSFQRAGGEKGELRNFQVDDREVTVSRGEYLFLALVGTGTAFPELEGNLARFLDRLEADERAVLLAWDGFSDGLGDARRTLTAFLRKGYRRRPLFARRSPHGE